MRKILHIFLSLVIVYAGTVSAYANTSIGGWSALDVITAGATNTINATKTAGGKVLTSAITIAPQAGKVGKYLLRGGAAGALAMAVPQLIGEGVDWVLDPANNAVKYKDDSGSGSSPSDKFVFSSGGGDFADPISASRYRIDKLVAEVSSRVYIYSSDDCPSVPTSEGSCDVVYNAAHAGPDKFYTVRVNIILNPNYDPDAPADGYKSIPIETVAAQVISNAEAGDPSSQEAVKATALEGFAAGEHDAALDAAAVESDAGTENPPDTTNPDNPAPTDPAAPFDPSSIIAAITALKALLAGILSSITGLSDLFNDTPPEKTKEETDVPVEAPPDVKNPNEFDVDYIGFSSQCPTLSPFSVGIGSASSTMTFDMTPLCNLAVTIRPAIIAIAYFIGLGVIASAIRET